MERIFRLTMQETIDLAAKALLEREALIGDFEVGSMHSINLDLSKQKAEVAFVEITATAKERSS
jgi:hypothetical protein